MWNGALNPEATVGAPGDFYINTATNNLFGPKSVDGTWPTGVSLVGARGASGASGSAGARGDTGDAGATGPTGISAPIATGEDCIDAKCTYKIGDTGPGGGIIFFVDYNDIYVGFDYLEAAPANLPGADLSVPELYDFQAKAGDANFYQYSISGAYGWNARAVGRGETNTAAIVAFGDTSGAAYAANAYDSPSYNSVVKSDWFLGSSGEMQLMFNNLQGRGDFSQNRYWSSSENNTDRAWSMNFYDGLSYVDIKTYNNRVRPVRSF